MQPADGSHVSSVQTLLSSQITGMPGRQTPLPQVSPVVQRLPSSHGLVLFPNTHCPVAVSQLSSVQGFLSSQGRGPQVTEAAELDSFETRPGPVRSTNTQKKAKNRSRSTNQPPLSEIGDLNVRRKNRSCSVSFPGTGLPEAMGERQRLTR
jgi:hypothetical protein